VSQDPALEVLELGARVDSELLHEDLSGAPIRLECVLLASGAVEREHVLGPKPLPVRLLDDQAFELRKQFVVTSERELGVVEPFLCVEPAIRETWRFCFGHAFTAQIAERRPVPQLECRPQIVGGIGRREPCCPLHQLLEPVDVELTRVQPELVAGALGLDPVGADRPAQAVDVDLKRLHRRAGRVGAPQGVDQPVPRDDAVRVQQHDRQQRALFRRAKGGELVAQDGLDRPEQAEFGAHRPH
jgi:hypothetical protein